MHSKPPLPSIFISFFYACLSALVLVIVDASVISDLPSKQARLSTAYQQQRQLSSSSSRGRLKSFEPCELFECELPRSCKLVAVPDIGCSEEGPCHCLPSNVVQCSSHIHCVEGEVCAEVENFGSVCASESFVDGSDNAKKLRGENLSPAPIPSEEGLTFDTCKTDSCAFPRFCKTIVDEESDCRGDLACYCVPNPVIFCSSSRDCIIGETCSAVPDQGDICVSDLYLNHTNKASPVAPQKPADNFGQESATPTSEAEVEKEPDGSDGMFGFLCIGVEFLEHLPRETLRFKDDREALVLCDENGSCATPGHMVLYGGHGMMMVSYCKLVRCKRRVMKVNSPLYRRGMTIPSRTSELEFSVFAARYGTFTEEKVLNVALRFGL